MVARSVAAEPRSKRPPRGGIKPVLIVIASMLAVFVLHEARVVFIPIAIGLFLTMLVWPLQARLLSRFVPWIATAVTVLLFTAVAGIVVAGIALVINIGLSQFGGLQGRILESFRNLIAWGESRGIPIHLTLPGGAEAAAQGQDVRRVVPPEAMTQMIQFLTSGIGSALGVMVAVGLALAVMVLALLELPRWDARLEAIYGAETYARTRETLLQSATQFRRYLWSKALTGLAAGIMTWLLCVGLGIPMALVWGVLSMALNFIPNVGVFISGVPPLALTLILLGPGPAALFLAGIVAIELITANLLEPLVQGKSMIISPLEALIALIFWGWLWGAAGALLSVPLTAALIVALRHVPRTRPLGRLLTD